MERFGIFLVLVSLCYTSVNALQDGDVRVVQVEEFTQGVVETTNATVSYFCSSEEEVFTLQGGVREECNVTNMSRHVALQPIIYDNKAFLDCITPWAAHNNLCSRGYPDKGMNWQKTRIFCRSVWGDLPRIPDVGTNNYISSLLQRSTWILINDRRVEGVWEYDFGETETYGNWDRGEPNNAGGGEDCVYTNSGRMWNDSPCSSKTLSPVCSRDTIRGNISCVGNETRLGDCQHSNWTYSRCGASEIVKVSCGYTHTEKSADGTGRSMFSVYRGFLQIRQGYRWLYLCDSTFSIENSRVACKQLIGVPHHMYYFSKEPGTSATLTKYDAGCDGGLTNNRNCAAQADGQFFCPNQSIPVTCHQRQVCVDGLYGENCTTHCGQCAEGTCSSTDGTCPEGGCKPGYQGDRCDQVCSDGYWGWNCTEQCGHCLSGNFNTTGSYNAFPGCSGNSCNVTGVCNHVSGRCPGDKCDDGYVGQKCDQACEAGAWGPECKYKCGNCNETSCNVTNGRCLSGVCQDGYSGDDCRTGCSNYTWGRNCNSTCGKCVRQACDVSTGACTLGVCLDGYTWEKCDRVCPINRWGMNCMNHCGKCASGFCDVKYGNCSDGQCQPGYEGGKCDKVIITQKDCDGSCPVCPLWCGNGGGDAGRQRGANATESPANQCQSWAEPAAYTFVFLGIILVAALFLQTLYYKIDLPKQKERATSAEERKRMERPKEESAPEQKAS